MSRVPWHLFQARQTQAHLIVALLEQSKGHPVGGDEFMAVRAVFSRLVSKQKPTGAYALTAVRQAGRPEVYLAFENRDDAQKFASTVNAKSTGDYPGWASQRAFQLDGST
jgi:hypothetical protein